PQRYQRQRKEDPAGRAAQADAERGAFVEGQRERHEPAEEFDALPAAQRVERPALGQDVRDQDHHERGDQDPRLRAHLPRLRPASGARPLHWYTTAVPLALTISIPPPCPTLTVS